LHHSTYKCLGLRVICVLFVGTVPESFMEV